jgi:hypothetical protein
MGAILGGKMILSDSHWHVRYLPSIFLYSKMFPQHSACPSGTAIIEQQLILFEICRKKMNTLGRGHQYHQLRASFNRE